eukprot:scaffold27443_cov60-Phaeocystis_antarctica.AAC.3
MRCKHGSAACDCGWCMHTTHVRSASGALADDPARPNPSAATDSGAAVGAVTIAISPSSTGTVSGEELASMRTASSCVSIAMSSASSRASRAESCSALCSCAASISDASCDSTSACAVGRRDVAGPASAVVVATRSSSCSAACSSASCCAAAVPSGWFGAATARMSAASDVGVFWRAACAFCAVFLDSVAELRPTCSIRAQTCVSVRRRGRCLGTAMGTQPRRVHLGLLALVSFPLDVLLRGYLRASSRGRFLASREFGARGWYGAAVLLLLGRRIRCGSDWSTSEVSQCYQMRSRIKYKFHGDVNCEQSGRGDDQGSEVSSVEETIPGGHDHHQDLEWRHHDRGSGGDHSGNGGDHGK